MQKSFAFSIDFLYKLFSDVICVNLLLGPGAPGIRFP